MACFRKRKLNTLLLQLIYGEEKKVAYVRGNNNNDLTIPSTSSDFDTSILNEGNSQKGIKIKKTIKIRKGGNSKQAIPVSSGVKTKQVELLPPEYFTAILNNTQVVKIKHPSLLPTAFPKRNPSKVSLNSDSNINDSLFSDSDHDSESNSEVFSSDSHVSEEKMGLPN
jgi:hypothetical protein